MADVTCKKLADLYASRTGKGIPKSEGERKDWLLTEEWLDKDGNSKDNGGKAPFVKLQEEGFLAWVNERGMKRVNKVLGNFVEGAKDGKDQSPNANVPQPTSDCWGVCKGVNHLSEMCFECVTQKLGSNEDDIHLLGEAVACQTCVGDAKGGLVDEIWRCVDGRGPEKGFPKMLVAILAIVAVVVILIGTIVGVYFRDKKAAEIKAGIRSPTGLPTSIRVGSNPII